LIRKLYLTPSYGKQEKVKNICSCGQRIICQEWKNSKEFFVSKKVL